MTQNEQYQEYALKAEEQFEHASSEAAKVVWLFIAQSWLNLLPQGRPKTE